MNGASVDSAIAQWRNSTRPACSHCQQQSNQPFCPFTALLSTPLSLGLHLNLTEGTALSDTSFEFLGKEGFWNACEAGTVTQAFIAAELRAQLEAFITKVGAPPLFVNGHNHIHVLPTVVSVLCELLPGYGVKWIRLPVEQLAAVPAESLTSSNNSYESYYRADGLSAQQLEFYSKIIRYAKVQRPIP